MAINEHSQSSILSALDDWYLTDKKDNSVFAED